MANYNNVNRMTDTFLSTYHVLKSSKCIAHLFTFKYVFNGFRERKGE